MKYIPVLSEISLFRFLLIQNTTNEATEPIKLYEYRGSGRGVRQNK